MGSLNKNLKAIKANELPIENKYFDKISMVEVAEALEKKLKENFTDADVSVVDCEDLTKSPWNLAAPGIGGLTRLLDIGGVPYLTPTVQRHKLYDMKEYPSITGLKEGLVIGAGAAPWPFLNRNAEMMPNLLVGKEKSVLLQKTHISRTFDEDNSFKTQKLPPEETRNSLLGNLFISEGKPGKVLKIQARKRKGATNFTNCLREGLQDGFPNLFLGLGGVFHVNRGKVKVHIMPDFSPCPLVTDKDVNDWLKFYEVDAPFTVLSTLVSNDPGLDLRPEHSHGWGDDGSGGHYHCDTTPEEVEYVGYFNLADKMYRVDRPGHHLNAAKHG